MHFANKNGTMALVKRFTKTNREVYNMSIVALLIGLGPLIGWDSSQQSLQSLVVNLYIKLSVLL